MDSIQDQAALRAELIKVLQQPDVDYNRVVGLSQQIASSDPNELRFSVDASVITRIGRELVARQETAVSELVKNAYDADAQLVELTFTDSNSVGGSLLIEDDGIGMTRQQLVDGFMRLSSADKVNNPISPIYERMRAGRKGIGRFAAQRLGNKLTIVTQTKESSNALSFEIDWRRFKNNQDLVSIASPIRSIAKLKEQGTSILIGDLIDAWSTASISRIFRYIADLLQPFPLSEVQQRPNVDPGFQANLYRSVDGKKELIANVEETIFGFALADIEAFVDSNGIGAWSIRSAKLDLDEKAIPIGKDRDRPTIPFEYLKDVYVKAYYFIYDSSYVPLNYQKLIREMAREQGGIRIYRNGFRVLPYGEKFNDWLRLDDSSARRLLLPPHANINFFGFVQITDPEGALFQETSSREGLIENDAFVELGEFVGRVVRDVALRVASIRGRKQLPKWGKSSADKTVAERLTAATATLDNIIETLVDVSTTEQKTQDLTIATKIEPLRDLALEIQDTALQSERETTLQIEEREVLRVLASVGQAIGEFTHEFEHNYGAILANAYKLRDSHPDLSHGEDYEAAKTLVDQLEIFKIYTGYFYKAMAENARREMAPQELGVIIRAFCTAMGTRYGTTIIEPDVVGLDLYTCPSHPAEWAAILFNLFTNAKKAIKRQGDPGRILLRAGREADKVYIELSDTGDGIDPSIEDRLFEAFATTTSSSGPYGSEDEEVLGSGLGLKIVNDMVMSYGGQASVVAPPPGYSTCFRIEVPAATEKELSNYDL
jgi:signal transduction histidine kinase